MNAVLQILPVPVLAEDLSARNCDVTALVATTTKSDAKDHARESTQSSTNDVKLAPLATKTAQPNADSDSRGGQSFSEDGDLDEWLAMLPRKTRFDLAMAISAVSMERGQCRSRDDLVCFLSAAGLPVSRQAVENLERNALRKCRERGLAMLAKEHLTIR